MHRGEIVRTFARTFYWYTESSSCDYILWQEQGISVNHKNKTMHDIKISVVKTRKDLERFIQFRYDLYRDWLLAGKPMRAVRGVS